MMGKNPKQSFGEQRPTLLIIEETDEFKRENPKCKGCPYGSRQYCVGICWRDVYESVRKTPKEPRVEVTTITEVRIIE